MAWLRLRTLAAVFNILLISGIADKCGKNHWQCDDGACILRSWRCDGAGDCLDGSDEMDCTCPPEDFECFSGAQCVNRAAVCDGLAECPDGSDELNCNQSAGCLSGDWMCKNSICVLLSQRCNGVNDCGDNSDEEGCGPCGDLNVRCPNGTCLTLRERCDGVAQCSDRRDEPVTCGKMCREKNGGCSHTCTDQLWGALCSCPSGMKISANGAKCEDVDECAQSFAPCLHTCINTKGSYKCRCHSGFKLVGGNVCEAEGNDTKLITARKGFIGLVTIKNRSFKSLLVVKSDPVSLTFDIASNLIYWCDGNGNIYKAADQKIIVLYSGQSGIKSLTVDWLTGQLYWTNSKLKAIYTGAPDGSAVGVVMSKDTSPTDLVLLPTVSAMFWINKGINEAMTIERAGMDGSYRTSLVVVTAQLPKALTLDVAAQRLYWLSDFKMSLESVKVDGTGRHTFQDIFKGRMAQSLAAFNGWFYWADDSRLWQAPQNQTGEKRSVLKGALPVLTVYHELQQPRGPSPCRKSACQLCLPSPANTFTCYCPEGKLLVSGGSCESFKLAYATSESIFMLEYTADGPVKFLIFSSTEDIQSFDVDLKRGWIIWANGTGHVKARLPSQDRSEYIPTPSPACTVRVDSKTGNLYWVSCDGLSIGVTHISLPDRSVSQQLYQASAEIHGLYVDWQRNLFYWLEDGQIIKMKLSLLGGNAKAVFSLDKSVRRIVLDRKANGFLWKLQNELQVMSLLKMRKYSAGQRAGVPGLIVAAYEPYMVTMHNHILTLWKRQDGTLVRAVAVEGDVAEVTLALNEFQQDLALLRPVSSPQATCKSPSVLCSGTMLCISKAQLCDGKQDCPDGSDEASCVQRCSKPDDFQCKDRKKCIERYQVCNGQPDCADGSDEMDCPVNGIPKSIAPLKCRLGSKPCKDGRECVLYSHVCDGEVDCSDGSDEQECVNWCRADQFQCAHGRMCIDKKEVCDGTPQCQDRSDEMDCFTRTKSCNHRCDDQTRCIPESFLCDGERDCADGTDEADCHPRASATVAPRYETSTEPVCKSPSVLCLGTSLCITQSQVCDGILDCPDGFDELHCIHACSDPGHFLCKNKRKCIERVLVCDGRADCPDDSDELLCRNCLLHCDEGTVCLTEGQYCDGHTDCADGSDEQNCHNHKAGKGSALICAYGFKPCRDGSECILNSHVCDGEKDCKDGSDEKNCERKCQKDQFQCAHGRMCIDKKEVCDGTPQCQDRSDELDCFDCSHRCDGKTRCLSKSFLCDGERDCADGTDEADCHRSFSATVAPRYETSTEAVCKSPSVLCEGTSLCISQAQLCDGSLDCPDGFDELHCLHVCSDPGHFLCKTRMKCIERTLVCNGLPDCPDGSDEQNCHNNKQAGKESALTCAYGFKPCRDGSECILNNHVCDGEKDCKDGSDEKDCERKCQKDQFQCTHGRMCIDKKEVCDGTPQCQDRSDELDCFDCSHRCDGKTRCLPESFLCDGERDCADGTDEADCHRSFSATVAPRYETSTEAVCKSPSVLCEGTSLCISQSQLCDGSLDCPDGFDELHCLHVCSDPGHFLCKTRMKCIERTLVCNGLPDCPDGSDEQNCHNNKQAGKESALTCAYGFKPCRDGSECILNNHVCDGEKDCKDGSDEKDCERKCQKDQFRCAHGRMCIDKKEVCDGTPQCQDRSDELDCFDCSHRCDGKTRCLPESFLCDGERDCADGTDEADCHRSFSATVAPRYETSTEAVCKSPSVLCEGTSLCISQSQLCDGSLDCPDGFDELHCLHVCSDPGHFLCKTRMKCIERTLVCNGLPDCPDGSDELQCPTCPLFCDEGTVCLTKGQYCDGQMDCRDGSDEQNCSKGKKPVSLKCPLGLKPCRDGSQCIHNSHVCDGEKDCRDGSDEKGCERKCKKDQFQCAHGRMCIDKKEVCDGTYQCQDRSDEMDCFTPTESCSHRCDNKTHCIPEKFRCDGERDCADGTDEADCATDGGNGVDGKSSLKSASTVLSWIPPCHCPSVPCEGTTLCISQNQICDGKMDCPDGSDELFCVDPCTKMGDFLCKDRKKCILRDLVCDKRLDCSDGSDEEGCLSAVATPKAAPLICRLGSKLCKDGTDCVLYSHVCDGEVDCKDGSDEDGCDLQCNPGQFQCSLGRKCIDRKQVCDGTPQCPDNSDEATCWTPTRSCALRCDQNSRCIPEVFICNGFQDCWDGSDETDCGRSPENPRCRNPSIPCLSTSQCITPRQLCDGRKDCADGSDERPCLQTCPYDDDFLCKDRRRCIERKLVCDGRLHCTDGSDEVNCPTKAVYTTEPAPSKCRLGLKPCKDGIDCILYSHVCDGEVDCKDGSDEEGCDGNCQTGEFLCAHGKKCIDAKFVCDGKPHCQDRSDEMDCFTRTKSCSHRCDNKTRCIPEGFLCDGERDCVDGTDEAACGYPTQLKSCESPSVLCRGGKLCISSSQVCDGKRDCPDGFDEESCIKKCPKRGDFLCKDRRKCVEASLICDGRPNCADASDERNCPTVSAKSSTDASLKCRFGWKPCKDGSECILYSHVCDGEVDCKDGSDEEECQHQCAPDQFHCAHGRMCIDKKEVCDGTPQCQDRSDEMDCFTHKDCSHRCDNKTRCLPETFLCDGEKDCADGTDEAGCPPVTAAPPKKPHPVVSCKSPSVLCEGTSLCITQSQMCDGKLDCPDGFDELHCLQACSDPGHFFCKDKRKCVERTLVCNGRPDCADGSDELQCPTCPMWCDQGTVCLTKAQYCDGRLDCKDGSDERNCYGGNTQPARAPSLKCRMGFKPCRDGSDCVLYSHVCDGEKDCKDGSDEKDCERKCKKGQFQCAHGRKCIDRKEVCDGTPQCQDRSDEINCLKIAEGCSHMCDNRSRCIPETFLCDGERDCLDGTDETSCAKEPCSLGQFQCVSGQCVSLSVHCDGHADCRDQSDEKNCLKPPHCPQEQRCPNSHVCLLKEWLCDGDKDCRDGSDEQNCKTPFLKCGPYQWSCESKNQCIPTSWRCDGVNDCKDHSDEAGCGMVKCPTHLFKCGSEECVDPKLVCNGISDCVDGSDEGSGCLGNNCSSRHNLPCEHYCFSTPQGTRCGCQAGFELQADGYSCADIDECKNIPPPVCNHKCVNTHGSCVCQCHPGFILEPDGSSCKTSVEPFLLASVQYELLSLGLRDRNLRLLHPPGQKPIFTLDYDWHQQRVFWVSLEEESIKYAIHGEKGNIRTLVKGVKSDSLAVDWLAKNLYWVDGVAGQILAVRIGDSVVKPKNFTVILDEDLEKPLSLVLLPQKGLMLWSEIGADSKIKQASMDGSEVKVVLSHGLTWPVALAVDLVSDSIYWVDEKLKCIGTATMNGDNFKLLQLTETSSPFSLAVFSDMVYWSDSQRLAIHGAHKITGKNRKVILKRPGRPFGIKIAHPLLQPKTPNPCEKLQCSHICVLAPGSQGSCRCPAGLLLAQNGFSCKPPEDSSDSFLLLLSPTRLTKVFTGNLRGKVGLKQWPDHRALSLPGVNEASVMDLVIGNTLYVADTSKASVAQIKLSGSTLMADGYLLQLPGDSITALAVDWITHNLYWSSSKKPQIHVSSAGGMYTTMVLDSGFQDTTSIALHPPTGRLCFTALVVLGNEALPQVACAAMDGRNRMVLWKKPKMPRFLTFSSQGKSLYWADIADEVICSVDVDGSNYREFKTGTNPHLIVSLAQSDNIFFWSTRYNGTSRVWYSDGVQPKRLWFEVQTNIVALKAFSKYSQKGTNLCAENNGGCSHLCLAYPGGRVCRCTQGYIAVNDTQCISGTQCPAGTKPCSDLFKCIPSTRFCDKIPDCLDGSDEDNCATLDNVLVRTLEGEPCDSELCNSRGHCVVHKGKPSCDCMHGYSGKFCQDGGPSSAPVVLAVLFIIGLVIVAAVVLKWRREKTARGPSIDKETLMKDLEEQEAHPENFSNELYNPVDEEQATSVN